MRLKVDIEVAGQVQQIALENIEDESKAIEYIWNTYGYATPIHRIYNEEE